MWNERESTEGYLQERLLREGPLSVQMLIKASQGVHRRLTRALLGSQGISEQEAAAGPKGWAAFLCVS